MQLKFNNHKSTQASIAAKLIKFSIFLIIVIIAIFFVEKINFPSPEKSIKKDISNEAIKLR